MEFVDYKMIGARIRDARKKSEHTQEWLAEKLNVTVGYISQVERGATKISLNLLTSVSAILGCDLSTLITGASVESPEYLSQEISHDWALLTQQEKRLVHHFIKLLIDMREKDDPDPDQN